MKITISIWKTEYSLVIEKEKKYIQHFSFYKKYDLCESKLTD